MNCEVCGKGPQSIILLPLRQADGKLNTFACLDCSLESDVYCQKHGRSHLGFEDETTACTNCVEEIVEQDGEKIAGVFAGKINQSEYAQQILLDINDWYDLTNQASNQVSLGEFPLALRFRSTPHALNIARLITTKALRMKTTPEEVIEEVARKGSEMLFS